MIEIRVVYSLGPLCDLTRFWLQWLLYHDGDGIAYLKSKYNGFHVNLNGVEDPKIIVANHPFQWKISKCGGRYRSVIFSLAQNVELLTQLQGSLLPI